MEPTRALPPPRPPRARRGEAFAFVLSVVALMLATGSCSSTCILTYDARIAGQESDDSASYTGQLRVSAPRVWAQVKSTLARLEMKSIEFDDSDMQAVAKAGGDVVTVNVVTVNLSRFGFASTEVRVERENSGARRNSRAIFDEIVGDLCGVRRQQTSYYDG